MERSTFQLVTFHHPFRLNGVEGIQPPGTYEVETVEQSLDQLSFSAYLRVATTITLSHHTSQARQVNDIDPDDLAKALRSDKEKSNAPP